MWMSYIYCDQLTTYLTYLNIVYIECMCVEIYSPMEVCQNLNVKVPGSYKWVF